MMRIKVITLMLLLGSLTAYSQQAATPATGGHTPPKVLFAQLKAYHVEQKQEYKIAKLQVQVEIAQQKLQALVAKETKKIAAAAK